MTENVTINRTYKDRLFKIIFEDRKELLSLYNALTGKNYQNPDELEINTGEREVESYGIYFIRV